MKREPIVCVGCKETIEKGYYFVHPVTLEEGPWCQECVGEKEGRRMREEGRISKGEQDTTEGNGK
jgi:hypothetical protein